MPCSSTCSSDLLILLLALPPSPTPKPHPYRHRPAPPVCPLLPARSYTCSAANPAILEDATVLEIKDMLLPEVR